MSAKVAPMTLGNMRAKGPRLLSASAWWNLATNSLNYSDCSSRRKATNMALRVLSGMIFIPRGGSRRGSVEISFNPFALANASNALFELRKRKEIGPSGRFIRSPASIVAVRQFDIVPIGGDFRVNLSDSVTRDSISIRWRPSQRVDQEEIPFMIIGEVPDPVPVRVVGTGTLVREPSDVLRRERSGSARARGKKKRKA
jgi:hypothetical protein